MFSTTSRIIRFPFGRAPASHSDKGPSFVRTGRLFSSLNVTSTWGASANWRSLSRGIAQHCALVRRQRMRACTSRRSRASVRPDNLRGCRRVTDNNRTGGGPGILFGIVVLITWITSFAAAPATTCRATRPIRRRPTSQRR
jgi:hypothetical protein